MLKLPEQTFLEFLKKHGKSLIGKKLLAKDGRIFEVTDVTPTGFRAKVVPRDVVAEQNARWN